MPLYRAFALILVKVKRIFWKPLARKAPTRTYIIYTPKTDCSLRVLACPSHETAVARDELAVYTQNSLENLLRISCSRQKVVRLFKKWYDFSESGTTFQKVLPLFRISAVPIAVLAVPVAVSAIPVARNAHPAHANINQRSIRGNNQRDSFWLIGYS